MKNISIIGTIAILLSCFLASCGDTEYTKERAKIDQLISNREFEKAREIANQIPDDEGGWTTDEKGLTDFVYWKHFSLAKINTAQMSLMIENGELMDAEAFAKEMNATTEFWQLIEKSINKIYAKDCKALCFVLPRYPFENSQYFRPEVYDYNAGVVENWYNEERIKYNELVTQALDMAIYEENVENIKRILPLFKEQAVETSRKKKDGDKYVTIYFKLENKAKAEALRKIKEAGINL